MEKEEVKHFIKKHIEGYGGEGFQRNENGQYIYTCGHHAINIEYFFEELIESFIEKQMERSLLNKRDNLEKLLNNFGNYIISENNGFENEAWVKRVVFDFLENKNERYKAVNV